MRKYLKFQDWVKLFSYTHQKFYTFIRFTLNPHIFQLYDVVVSMLSEKDLPVPVLGVALLCLAELCAGLKAHSIAKLGVFIPPLIDLLRRQEYLLE